MGDAGRSPLADRFVERMADRYGWSPDPARLHELADVMQGVALAVHHLTSPGDGIVLHTPAYHPFLAVIAETGDRWSRSRRCRPSNGSCGTTTSSTRDSAGPERHLLGC